jgi:hypothetical protein
MELDKNKCDRNPKKSPITFNNLNFISCVFFSDKQFNTEKIHKPLYSLCIEKSFFATTVNSIENEITSILDDIYKELNRDNTLGIPIKIPAPIYVLLGRELEYNNNILESERFLHLPPNKGQLGKVEIKPDEKGSLAILDYLNSFFKESGLATDDDKKKYEKSHLNNYRFKGNIKILLYVPYLSNEYRYISNFQDILNSSTFFYNLIMSDVFLKFERTSNIDKEFIKNLKKMNFNKKSIDFLTSILRDASKSKFLLYDDLNNLCFEGGCVSSVGEDLKVLIPNYDKDDGTNSENAVKFSPFLPNKCLSKTNNFLCNVRYAKDYNKNIDDFIKEYAMADIKNGLSAYSMINDMINKKIISEENVSKIDKFKSPLNLIISIINSHIKSGYSDDLNKGEREITIKEKKDEIYEDKKINVKYNHYSKEYSENIIKELSLLNDKYPGVPEIVMSLYIYNETLMSDKITYMPWGNELLTLDYLFYMNSPLDVDSEINSFNNKYAITINKKGLIYVYNKDTKNILYFINKKTIINPISFMFDKSGFIVQLIDDNNNQRSEKIDINVSKIIADCNECVEPYTMIIDNNGFIKINGNSFYDVTNKDFSNFINNEIDLLRRYNYNIDNIDNLDNLNISIKQFYQYCDNSNNSCTK